MGEPPFRSIWKLWIRGLLVGYIRHSTHIRLIMSDISTAFASDPELMQMLGRRLKALRKYQELTLNEVAQRASLNKSTVVQAEKGRNPTLLTLLRLLRVYGRAGVVVDMIPEPGLSPLKFAGRG